jgi:pentalenolactone synthase
MHRRFSYPVSASVICDHLGVPPEERDEFQTLIDQASSMYDRNSAQAGFANLMAYMDRLVGWKAHHPGDDVMTDLLRSRERAELATEEVVRVSMSLLFAGNQSTAARIDFGTVLLLCHPDQLAAMRRDPALVAAAVDEILRRAAPNPAGALRRYARQNIDVHGVHIAAGDLLLVGPQTANHDPEAFPEPDRFDITRKADHHIAFGYGTRFCLGAGLARLILEAVFGTLFSRLPALRLAVPVQDLRLRDDLLTGGLAELPVSW